MDANYLDTNYIVIDSQPINWVYPPASGIIWRPFIELAPKPQEIATAAMDWDKLARKSWILYQANRSYGPPTKSWQDRLRWWLRCKLIEYRVI